MLSSLHPQETTTAAPEAISMPSTCNEGRHHVCGCEAVMCEEIRPSCETNKLMFYLYIVGFYPLNITSIFF